MSKGKCSIGDLLLESGEVLKDVEIAYKTYGILNEDRSNVVLVFHALTGNTEAADWWNGIIGKDKPIDPQEQFIICFNTLGSCYGSTGPESINPSTGEKYGNHFPKIAIRDIARSQLKALEELGIDRIRLGIGGSMGAMVLLELAVLKPTLFEQVISIACGASHSAWRIAFSSVIKRTIQAFGDDDLSLIKGMKLARQLAMTTYRCSDEFESRFAREQSDGRFEVENYLEYQGEKIAARFSPHSYLRLTEAMESYDLCNGRSNDRNETLSAIEAEVLCVGINSDILYPEKELQHFASQFSHGTYKSLRAGFGHDSFLVAQDELAALIAPVVALQEQYEEAYA